MKYWYAIQTISGKESLARIKIKSAFSEIETLLPQRKLEIRKLGIVKIVFKPLFPGYFFIKQNFPLKPELAQKIIDTAKFIGVSRGVIKILGKIHKNDNYKIIQIPEEEMEHVLFLTRENEIVDFSTYIKEGQKVKIVAGPLKGYETIIKRVDPRKKRIFISLSLFGQNKEIALGGEFLEISEGY